MDRFELTRVNLLISISCHEIMTFPQKQIKTTYGAQFLINLILNDETKKILFKKNNPSQLGLTCQTRDSGYETRII